MAKSARASSKKANRTELRKKVFGPVEDARNCRLADKLMDLASKSNAARQNGEMNDNARTKFRDVAVQQSDVAVEINTMEVEVSGSQLKDSESAERKDRGLRRKRSRKSRSTTMFPIKHLGPSSARGKR